MFRLLGACRRFGACFLLTSSVLLAASSGGTVTVAQLVMFMKSSVQQKIPDKQVAQYLAHMKLSERLDAKTVEDLQGDGLGPKTVAALKELISESSNLTAPPVVAEAPKAPPIPPPSYDEEQQVIGDMTEYAMNYTQRLPDFICTQVTRRYADPRFRGSWINVDSVVAKVSYNEGHENYEVKLVNNTLVDNKSMDALGGAISTGEFGSTMKSIFDSHSGAEFHFDHWATLRGQRVYVFNYQIEQSRSDYSIDYDRKERIVAAYKGLVYVDKATHKIARITAEAVDIPADFPVRSASSIVDYEQTTIGTRDFIVPIKAEMKMKDAQMAMRNVIEFRSYRKFGAETNIIYSDVPEPMDDSKTKEEAPKQ